MPDQAAAQLSSESSIINIPGSANPKAEDRHLEKKTAVLGFVWVKIFPGAKY